MEEKKDVELTEKKDVELVELKSDLHIHKEGDTIALSKEEIAEIQQYQRTIDQSIRGLGSVRRQFVLAENQILKSISEIESKLLENIKKFAGERNLISEEEKWVFDPQKYTFIKAKE